MSDAPAGFRDFENDVRPGVRDFYRANHTQQTLAFVLAKKAEYLPLRREEMSVWTAIERLDEIVDESDPDTELSQLDHGLQTAEAMRRAGEPRWMVLTGFIHDLGKVLCLFGEPQWAVVGDTFPVGCGFSDRNVYPELFAENPDTKNPELQSETGIYEPGCGLDAVHLSWGHDEYLYHVVRDHLPDAALSMIRYHSFYAWHSHGAHRALMNARDEETLRQVRHFNHYDLYSKADARGRWESLRPYYEELIAEFLPARLQW